MKIEVYFNGKKFFGNAAYINGWNGYEASSQHGILCALIPDSSGVPSCWDDNQRPNVIVDKNGMIIRIPSLAGNIVSLNGFINIGYDTICDNEHEDFVRLIDRN